MKHIYGKKVLVTGASSGIGLQTAILLASNGYEVYGASRNCENKIISTDNYTIHYHRMDVTNINSINDLRNKAGDFDIIIHCAGFGISGACEDVSTELVKKQFETNYYGVINVNSVFLPHMRQAGRGLIVVISSIAGQIPIPFQSHYSSSKYALEAYTECLRMECSSFNIKACIIEPGDTKTSFTQNRVLIDTNSPYYDLGTRAINKMQRDEQNGKNPSTVANTVLKILQKSNPPIRTIVGFDYKLLMILKRFLPQKAIHYLLNKIYLS